MESADARDESSSLNSCEECGVDVPSDLEGCDGEGIALCPTCYARRREEDLVCAAEAKWDERRDTQLMDEHEGLTDDYDDFE